MTYHFAQRAVPGFTVVALGLFAGTLGHAQPDPFKTSPTGTLTIAIEVDGYNKHVNPNKVEWHELNVARRVRLELPMVRMGTAPAGFRTSAKSQAALAQEASAKPPAGVMEMQKAMQACNGDQQCMMQTGMKYGRMMQEGKMEKPMGPSMADKDRFHHWTTDRRRPCASGTITIDEKGNGMVISPPNPAAPFNYRRFGEVRLPAELAPIIEKVCAATLAIDTKDRTLDIGISGLAVPVKLTYSGNAFSTESGRAVVMVEGVKNGVQVGAFDLFDFPVDPSAKLLTGTRVVEKVGQVTHAGGYGVAPVRAKVSWTFERN
jgi:hypothetical protein